MKREGSLKRHVPPRTSLARSPLTRGAAKSAKTQAEAARLAKLEPHKLAQTFETRVVRVGETEYDVTDFKHPGGSVIFYMLSNTGADATEAFKEFHMRSPKAWKMLKALPQRPAATPRSADPDAPMLEDSRGGARSSRRRASSAPAPRTLPTV